jgi:hypothetical protein
MQAPLKAASEKCFTSRVLAKMARGEYNTTSAFEIT